MPFYDGHDGTADSALVSSEGPSITVIPAYDSKDKPVVYIPIRVGRDASVIVEIQQTDQFHGTTGSTLWLGGQILSAYLQSLFLRKPRTSSKAHLKAIDLGAGLGLTSLALAACGFDVVATDLPVMVDGLLSKNISNNLSKLRNATDTCGTIHAHVLDWGSSHTDWKWPNDTHIPAFDVIVSADSIYSAPLITPLLDTVQALSQQSMQRNGKGPEIYIAYEHRDDAQYTNFLLQAEARGFHIKTIHADTVHKAVYEAYAWDAEQYEGISVFRMQLRVSHKS